MNKVFLSISLLFSPALGFANLNHELNKFYNDLDGSANVISGDIYNGQKAGYMTGGGVTVRNRVMSSKLVNVNLPRFDAGCGGIDIFAGGFSFINHDQLIHTLKGIGSNAVGYAFLLGIETMSPQVANTMKQLQSWANQINSLNINSCETASTMVGAVWPQKTMASQQICRSIGGKNGTFNDYVSARHKCSNSSDYDHLMDSMGDNNLYKDILADEYNIAWEAIQKQKFIADNRELSEFFMSLMGTIIIRKGTTLEIESWPSKIDDESFLKTIMQGGETEIYGCKNVPGKCLTIQLKKVNISQDSAWLGKIKNLLLGIQTKIVNDEELSQDERELISKTRLPLYKIINVLTAYKKGFCPIDLYQVADIVAMDLLIQYLREVVILVREGAYQLRRAQMYSEGIDEYLEELGRIEETIRYYETKTSNMIEREFQTIQKIQMIEEQIAAEIILN